MRDRGGLPAPVRPAPPAEAAAGQAEREVLDQEPVAVPLGQMLGLHHEIAQARRRGDDDLGLALAVAPALGQRLLVGLQTGFGFGLPRAGGHAHPLQLALEGALARALLLLLDGETLLLLVEPRGGATFPPG